MKSRNLTFPTILCPTIHELALETLVDLIVSRQKENSKRVLLEINFMDNRFCSFKRPLLLAKSEL